MDVNLLVNCLGTAATLRLTAIGLLCAFLGHAQISSNTLRTGFGLPIASGSRYEVFSKEGIDLRVRYSPTRNVCSIEIKPGQAVAATVEMVLGLAAPIAARGKLLNRLDEFDGISGVRLTYYEKVIIVEDIFTPPALDKRPGAIATFKEKECGWRDGTDPFDHDSHSPLKER